MTKFDIFYEIFRLNRQLKPRTRERRMRQRKKIQKEMRMPKRKIQSQRTGLKKKMQRKKMREEKEMRMPEKKRKEQKTRPRSLKMTQQKGRVLPLVPMVANQRKGVKIL